MHTLAKSNVQLNFLVPYFVLMHFLRIGHDS